MWNTGEGGGGGVKVMKVKVSGVRFLANGIVCGLRRDNIRKGKNKKEQNILYFHHYILALSTSAVLDVDQSTMGKFMQEIVKDTARNWKKQ